MAHIYYSHRNGSNPNLSGLPFEDIVALFIRVYDQLETDGFFQEDFGYHCTDAGKVSGKVRDVELEILLAVKKKYIWPIAQHQHAYEEDDLFDLIEFLYHHVSKPVDGLYHNYNGCGMHWETFSRDEGRKIYRERINSVLSSYNKRFELTLSGEILHLPEEGFETIFEADIPSKDANVVNRVNAAVIRYRRHGSTLDDRRQAVRDLADVLEYLRPQVKQILTSADDKDLFNIANNFGVRHHNDKQKTGYDAVLWLSWMFYFYLSTIHVLLRKINAEKSGL